MNIDLIPAGSDVPHSVNVLIEVPIGGEPVKYEFDKKSGAMLRRPHPAHADALPVQLWLHPADAVRRRRPARCAW